MIRVAAHQPPDMGVSFVRNDYDAWLVPIPHADPSDPRIDVVGILNDSPYLLVGEPAAAPNVPTWPAAHDAAGEPSTPFEPVALVYVAAGTVSIGPADITDVTT